MTNVLFLSAWYPHRYDKMAGLFVQKHAEAVSLYCNVKVLYVHADENIQTIEIIEQHKGKVHEFIVYYPCKKEGIFHKSQKVFKYLNAYLKGYKKITKTGFNIDITHVNVLTRTGVMAYLLKLHKGTPYVITEHWTRYLPKQEGYKGLLRKFATKIAVKNASAILPVSELLKKAMLSHNLDHLNYQIVNNVVDDIFFKNSTNIPHSKKRILHISCFYDIQKNISGVLRAALALTKIRQDFELVIIGEGIDFKEIKNYADSLNFPKDILYFTGEKSSIEVAGWLQNSDFFVLFSNYETAGVVIAESLVCGKPVLSTKVGAAPEYINNKNGILISVGDEIALFKEMNYLLDNLDKYNLQNIKENAKDLFNYQNIGKKIQEIYLQIFNNQQIDNPNT